MLNKLEKEGYIKKLAHDPRRVKNSLDLAQRDIDTTERMLKTEDYDWASRENFIECSDIQNPVIPSILIIIIYK